MFDRLTGPARRALVHARAEAHLWGHDSIEPEHVLLGLLRLVPEDGRPPVAIALLDALGVDLDPVRAALEERFRLGPDTTFREPTFAATTLDLFARARAEAEGSGRRPVGSEHLLLALVATEDRRVRPLLLDLVPRFREAWAVLSDLVGRGSVVAEPLASEASDPASSPEAGGDRSLFSRLVPAAPLFDALAAFALRRAVERAAREGDAVGPVHVLAGALLAANLDAPWRRRVRDVSVDAVADVLAHPPAVPPKTGDLAIAPATLALLSRALDATARAGRSVVDLGDLLRSLLADEGLRAHLRARSGVDLDAFRALLAPPEGA